MILVDLAQIAPILKRAGCLDAVMQVVTVDRRSLSLPSREHLATPRKAVVRPLPRTTPRPPVPKPVLPRTMPAHGPRRDPRVRYVARVVLTAPAVRRLPAHDLQVYRLIRQVPSGVTRAQLLSALRAHAHTGKVDGAVRRLRLKNLIKVTDAPTPGSRR